MKNLLFAAVAVGGGTVALRAARRYHERETERIWSMLRRLARRGSGASGGHRSPGQTSFPASNPSVRDPMNSSSLDTFDPSTLTDLPPPAQRYFRRAITPGTPLRLGLELEMLGSIRLAPEGELLPMEAEQILAPPHGFVWKAQVAKGAMRINGFDRFAVGRGLLKWWLYGLLPIVRGSGRDVDRSAAGRLAGESVLVPASLLPINEVYWEHVNHNTARATSR